MALEADDGGASVVSSFLLAWAAALATRDVDALAGLFDDAALFTATAPEPLQGRTQIEWGFKSGAHFCRLFSGSKRNQTSARYALM